MRRLTTPAFAFPRWPDRGADDFSFSSRRRNGHAPRPVLAARHSCTGRV